MLDLVRQEPGPGGALLQGLFFGRIAPPREERRTFTAPTLVLGHPRDPVHPFSDAGMLAKEMPNARLLQANSLTELRMQPERLTGEIAAFLDEVWAEPRARKARRANGSRQTRRRANRRARQTRAPSRSALRREQFDFVDVHVPGRGGGADRRCGRLADPQGHERERLLGVAQA